MPEYSELGEEEFENGPSAEDWLKIGPEDLHPEGGFEPRVRTEGPEEELEAGA